MTRSVRVAACAFLLFALVACGTRRSTPAQTATSDAVTPRSAYQDASEQSPPKTATSPSPPPHRGPFNAEAALAMARRLANEIGPRPAGSANDARARGLIATELRAAGWTVHEEPFPLPQGGRSANVVAWRGEGEPASTRPARHVVVGAHLDTVEGSPGANDNASGVAVIVALARELADETPAVPVILVAFGAEEYQPSDPPRHHVGSEQYAARYTGDVVAAVSLDMVANGDITCICWLHGSTDRLAGRLDTLAPPGSFAVRAEGDFSDHGPFAARGVPAVVLWTGRDGVYHTPRDTADLLDLDDLRRAGDLTLAFLRGLTAADLSGLRVRGQP